MDTHDFVEWLSFQRKRTGRRKGSALSDLTLYRYELILGKIPEFDILNGSADRLLVEIQEYLNEQTPIYTFVFRTYLRMLEQKHLDHKLKIRSIRSAIDQPAAYASVITNEEMAREMKLTKEEIRHLINTTSCGIEKLFIQLSYDTACRVREMCSIKPKDIYPDTFSIVIKGKGGLTRAVRFESSTYKSYPGYFEKEGRNGKIFPFEVVKAWRIVHEAGLNIGKRVSPHSLRHSRLSHLAELGWSAEHLKEFAGWSSIKMADTYIQMRQIAMQTGKFYKSTDLWGD